MKIYVKHYLSRTQKAIPTPEWQQQNMYLMHIILVYNGQFSHTYIWTLLECKTHQNTTQQKWPADIRLYTHTHTQSYVTFILQLYVIKTNNNKQIIYIIYACDENASAYAVLDV